MEIIYRQYRPSPVLRPYVEYYGLLGDEHQQLAGNQFFLHKCLPLGTAEIIITLSDAPKYVEEEDGRYTELPESYLVGIWTKKAVVRIPRGAMSFSISIRPEALWQIFGIRAGELWNDMIEGDVVFGPDFQTFVRQIKAADSDEVRIRLAEQYFLEKLRQPRESADYLAEAINRIRHSGGNASVSSISDHVYIGRRQLERTFKEVLGVTPKMYGRLARFSKAYELVQENPRYSWADISYGCGYADQAHFIRDFKAFTGESPTVFYTDHAALAVLPQLAQR